MRQLLAILILLATSLVARADITSNLVARWALDETSGTSAADSSGNGHTGTYVNTPTLDQAGAWAGGKAVAFASASTQYVSLGSKSAPTTISFAAWIKRTDDAANYTVHHYGRTHSRIAPGGSVVWYGDTGGSGVSWSAAIPATGTWYHVAVTQTGTTATLYVNGALVSAKSPSAVSATAGNSYLAILAASTYPLNGTIDDVRIYSRALSSGDVSELYAYTGAKAGIWHYYHQSSLKPCTRFFLPRTKPAETLYALSP